MEKLICETKELLLNQLRGIRYFLEKEMDMHTDDKIGEVFEDLIAEIEKEKCE